MTLHRIRYYAAAGAAALALVTAGAACGSDAEPAASRSSTPETTARSSSTSSSSSSSTTPSTTSTTTAGSASAERCSAEGLTADGDDQSGLPAAVATTRAAILSAARACDLERLEELSLAGDGTFTYSFGADGPAGLAAHLREREAAGEEIVRILVETLRLPSTEQRVPGDDAYVTWPSAAGDSPTDADWDALRPLYSDEEIAAWRAPDSSGFLGYRVGIAESGDWMFFVAGD